ncbi:hypothetical protein T484DRAFT_1892609 [Baffinella frigidus]|nr:hypothetical protein T484DRAFT_1892609 [Cryptophyta sp. CCMP2293]
MRANHGMMVAMAAILTSHISSFAPPPALARFLTLAPSRQPLSPVEAPEIRQHVRGPQLSAPFLRKKNGQKQLEAEMEAALQAQMAELEAEGAKPVGRKKKEEKVEIEAKGAKPVGRKKPEEKQQEAKTEAGGAKPVARKKNEEKQHEAEVEAALHAKFATKAELLLKEVILALPEFHSGSS